MKKAIVIGFTVISAIVSLIASVETRTTDSGYSYTYTSRYSHLDDFDLIKTAIKAKELG